MTAFFPNRFRPPTFLPSRSTTCGLSSMKSTAMLPADILSGRRIEHLTGALRVEPHLHRRAGPDEYWNVASTSWPPDAMTSRCSRIGDPSLFIVLELGAERRAAAALGVLRLVVHVDELGAPASPSNRARASPRPGPAGPVPRRECGRVPGAARWPRKHRAR